MAAIANPMAKGKARAAFMAKKSQTREDRLAAALRENLKRRKAAQRDRPAGVAVEEAKGESGTRTGQDKPTNCAGGQSRVGVAATLPARQPKCPNADMKAD